MAGCGGIPTSPPLLAVTGIRVVVQEEIEGGAVPLTPRPPVIRPLPGATVVVQRLRGQEVARGVSDANGRLTLVLDPGTYTVVPLRLDNNTVLAPANQTVTVRARALTNVTLTYQLLAP